jgi:hypothetical protein
MIAMAIYVVVLLWAWPLARATGDAWTRSAYALAPVVPLLYAIWQMARRVLAGDELEQRTHLIGLGVAATAVSVFGIVSGFLAAAHVLSQDWSAAALVWIFPFMVVVYAVARFYAARRYGSGACDEEDVSRAERFLYTAAIFAAIAAYAYWCKNDTQGAGFAGGMAAGMLGVAAFFALRERLRRPASE